MEMETGKKMRRKIVSLMDLTALDREKDTSSSVGELVLQGESPASYSLTKCVGGGRERERERETLPVKTPKPLPPYKRGRGGLGPGSLCELCPGGRKKKKKRERERGGGGAEGAGPV